MRKRAPASLIESFKSFKGLRIRKLIPLFAFAFSSLHSRKARRWFKGKSLNLKHPFFRYTYFILTPSCGINNVFEWILHRRCFSQCFEDEFAWSCFERWGVMATVLISNLKTFRPLIFVFSTLPFCFDSCPLIIVCFLLPSTLYGVSQNKDSDGFVATPLRGNLHRLLNNSV